MGNALLSKKTVCQRLDGVSLSTLNRWLDAGLIAYIKIAGRVLIPESELFRISGLARPRGISAPVVKAVEA